MSVYAKDKMVKYQGPGVRFKTAIAAEAMKVGNIFNVEDFTLYDSGDKDFGVALYKQDLSADFGGEIAVGDVFLYAEPGDDAIMKLLGSGLTAAAGNAGKGDYIIVVQDNLGHGKTSSTADDVALYKLGKAVEDQETDLGVFVDLKK